MTFKEKWIHLIPATLAAPSTSVIHAFHCPTLFNVQLSTSFASSKMYLMEIEQLVWCLNIKKNTLVKV